MNEEDLRDCFAMFAMMGLLASGNHKLDRIVEGAYTIADEMLEVRKPEETVGLPAIKKGTRK
jgi:hypothetical protein